MKINLLLNKVWSPFYCEHSILKYDSDSQLFYFGFFDYTMMHGFKVYLKKL